MKSVAIVSNNKYQNRITEDLNLMLALENEEINSEILSWENPNNQYDKYDCLIIRSIWGYHDEYSKFKAWLHYLEKNNIVVFNRISMLYDNILKDRQFEISDKYGINHIRTIFQKQFITNSIFIELKRIKSRCRYKIPSR